ncbi:efflux RND transporter permease subunit [Candidatus Spongiihabitans sp.]|uniref:efflux RND transporter permease subunit n=1 Tax=Candidatus Spongiihabitans sp. TaxID=3101308 RepID=UPI003C6FC300
MEQFAIKWGSWVTRNRVLTLTLSLMLAVAAASGVQFLGFTNDYRVFFSGDDPHLLAFENLQSTYTKNDNVLFVIAPEDGKVFTQDTLAAISDLTDRAWETPFSIRVDSLSNYQHTEAQGDNLIVADLYEDADSLSDADLARIQDIAVNEPFLVHRLISADARVAAINITVETPGIDEATEGPQVAEHVREMRSYVEQTYPNLKVYLTGIMMMNQAFPEASLFDMTHLLPAAFAIILFLVFLQLRGLSGTVTTFIAIALSIVSAMGMAGWMGIKLTPPSMSAPTIILTLAVADCVHVLANWLQKYRSGMDKTASMTESLRINFSPVLLTSLTTAIGFLSLNFSDAPPFGDLGNIAAMGVLFAWFYAMTLLPALVTLLPASNKKGRAYGGEIMNTFSGWVIRRRGMLMPVVSLMIVGLVLSIPKNQLNDVFVNYFDERIEFRTDTDFVVDNLTGMYFIDYSLNAGESGAISEPRYLGQVQQFTDWLRQQPEVIHVNTVTDVFKRINKSMHGGDPSWYALPEQREMAAQYLLLYEMSLPYGLDLNNQIDIDKQRTRLSATLKTLSTTNTLAFEDRASTWLQQNTPEIHTTGASPTIMFSHIGMRNIISMLGGTAFALVAISLLLILAFSSVRYGLLTLIPNIAPAAMAFGLWGIVDAEIGLGLSVVTAMTLGIVVDDTIHFMSKYLRARRAQGLEAIKAVGYAFSTVGIALWITSVALAAGFLVLSTSSFALNAEMGLLVAIVIMFALIVDFLLLPVLLIRFDQWLIGAARKNSEIETTTQSV